MRILLELHLNQDVVYEVAKEVIDILHLLKLITFGYLGLAVGVKILKALFNLVVTIILVFVSFWIGNERFEVQNMNFIRIVCPYHQVLGAKALILHQTFLDVHLLVVHVH